LVCIDEKKLIFDIEKLIKRDLPREIIEGFEVDPRIKAEPIRQKSGQGRPQNGGGGGNRNSKPRSNSRGRSGGDNKSGSRESEKPKHNAHRNGSNSSNGSASRRTSHRSRTY
jgi:ATP-dependent RNA helicase RhlE